MFTYYIIPDKPYEQIQTIHLRDAITLEELEEVVQGEISFFLLKSQQNKTQQKPPRLDKKVFDKIKPEWVGLYQGDPYAEGISFNKLAKQYLGIHAYGYVVIADKSVFSVQYVTKQHNIMLQRLLQKVQQPIQTDVEKQCRQ